MILSDVRVVELTIAWAGPLAGRWLADLGAEVIHLEYPTARGVGVNLADSDHLDEETRDWKWGQLPGPVYRSGIFPDADPGKRAWNRQGVFNKFQRNKLSLCLDLKAPGADDILADLLQVTDVLLDNYSPRAIGHLGLDYESLHERYPRLIRASLSGYGHTGPARMHPSWGPILEAQSGMASTAGYVDGGPLKMGAALPDPIGGLHGVVAILAALDERDRTGRGCFIDMSQLETYGAVGGERYLAASATGEPPPRMGNRSSQNAPQGVYPARGDDEWIAISVTNDDEWRSLAGLLGGDMAADDLASPEARRRRHDDIDSAIEAWTRGRDRFAAMHLLQERGVRASAVMTNRDIVENEHLAARGLIVEWDQVDVGPRRFGGFPVHFEDPARIPMRGAPGLGADNERILVDTLGYPPERVAELYEEKVIATSPT
jgi:crotonobetainyl-CoA:carnitine CoA-transferase CaiB-like acyl-CoA transferase